MGARSTLLLLALSLGPLGCSALFGLEDLTIGETTTAVGGSGAGAAGGSGGAGALGGGGTGGAGAVGGQGGEVAVPWEHVWSTAFGGPGNDAAWDLAIGPSDAVALAGGFQQTLDVAGTTLTAQSDDPFVVVGAAAGSGWQSAAGLVFAGQQAASGLAVAGDGSVVLAGAYGAAMSLSGCAALTDDHPYDIFVIKLDPAFDCDWAHGFGSAPWGPSYADYRVAFDPAGNVLVSGPFTSSITLPGLSLTAPSGFDLFVIRFDASTGVVMAGTAFHGAGNASVKDLAVDGSGNVLLAGWFDDTITFESQRTTAGQADLFVAKLDGALAPQWSIAAGDGESQAATAVAIDGSGNVVVGGYHRGAIDLGGGPLSSPADQDGWLARLDTDGQHLWSASYGGAGDQLVGSLAADGAGRIAVTGESRGEIDFGGGVLTSSGQTGVFLALLDSAGHHLRSMLTGTGGSSQLGLGVAFTSDGQTVVTGAFDGTVDFGGGPLTTAGAWDVFVARMGP